MLTLRSSSCHALQGLRDTSLQRQASPLLFATLFVALLAVGCNSEPNAANSPSLSDQVVASSEASENEEAIEQSRLRPRSASESGISEPATPKPAGQLKIGAAMSVSLFDSASKAFNAGDAAQARLLIRKHLIENPDDAGGLFLSAQISAALSQLKEAVETLDQIPRNHPQAGIAALGQSADWALQMQDWSGAESRYKELLRLIPNANMAHRRLAALLNRQGRRQEACEHVRSLCRAGDISQAELHTLISQSDAVFDEATDGTVITQGEFAPIGSLGMSRILASKNQFKEALSALAPDFRDKKLSSAGRAMYGRLATEVLDDQAINDWIGQMNPAQSKFSDHWIAIGNVLSFKTAADSPDSRKRTVELAARAYLEALFLDPTDWVTLSRLETCMDELGMQQAKETLHQRVTMVRKTLLLNQDIVGQDQPDPARLADLAAHLDAVGRPYEAIMWRALALTYGGGSQQEMASLNQRRQQLLATTQSDIHWPTFLPDIQRSQFPLPNASSLDRARVAAVELEINEPSLDQRNAPTEAVFVNRAQETGLQFQYLNAATTKLQDLQIYEQFGGGVAALDYDRDGMIDLFFAQGGEDPKTKDRGNNQDSLYRHLGDGFAQIDSSGVEHDQYSMGVTSGDWNQDGLADLLVARFGPNRLLLNQGDGTFVALEEPVLKDVAKWTSSVAIADVNGDHLPDLIEVNYIDDPEVHEITEKGSNGRFIRFRGPESYKAAQDRLIINAGDGQMQAIDLNRQSGAAATHGLGVVVTDIDGVVGQNGQTRNEIFVANDTDPNQLWTHLVPNGDAPNNDTSQRFVDTARLKGCAYSSRGGSSASMGIASADFDRNGSLDLHVTNFFNEPVHLYRQDKQQSFRDSPIQSDLYSPSMSVLGFGTEAFDYDNDGWPDIAVLNGHIDDLQFKGSPQRMKPQLFTGFAGVFQVLDLTDPSGYWNTPAIGRGLIRLDWNNDGKTDLVATHHDAPAALLENQTVSDHSWLQLQLVGCQSERDAIGARVEVVDGDRTWMDVVTTGDGYSCKSEGIISFGLAEIDSIDELRIHWPSGTKQRLTNVKANQRYTLVENESVLWPF